MEIELKVGDRVRIKGDSTKTEHVIEKITEGYYWLSGTDAFIGGIWLEKIEPDDPKTAFLLELKGLLEKYGAELGDSGMYEIEGMEVTFANGDRICYMHTKINALNIMDYEKG